MLFVGKGMCEDAHAYISKENLVLTMLLSFYTPPLQCKKYVNVWTLGLPKEK